MNVRRCLQMGAVSACLPMLLSCSMPGNRELQSITLSPVAAASEGAAVQFTATGHWTTAPATTTPLAASWGVCQNNAPTTGVTVTQAGLAACTSGAKGTYTVFADDPPTPNGPVCNVISACGDGCFINGTAQLTCP